jgi:hypothetical protein
MTPQSPPTWDHLQLLLIRWLSAALALVDGLFNVRWGERLLDRLTDRWKTELAQLEQALAQLDEERQRLSIQMEAIAIHTAVIYLSGRLQTRRELRFDPADPHDEQLLDASIDTLVKERLATIETEEIQPMRYTYTLELDWPAIRARLASAIDHAQPELADWLHEGIRFIDSSGQPATQTDNQLKE